MKHIAIGRREELFGELAGSDETGRRHQTAAAAVRGHRAGPELEHRPDHGHPSPRASPVRDVSFPSMVTILIESMEKRVPDANATRSLIDMTWLMSDAGAAGGSTTVPAPRREETSPSSRSNLSASRIV